MRLRILSSGVPAALLLLAGIANAQVGVTITLSTVSNSLQGGQTTGLQAIVVAASGTNLGVTWTCSAVPAVPDVCAGFSATGTPVQSNGISTNTFGAPAVVTTKTTVTITATSIANSTKTASVTITLNTAAAAIDIGSGAPTQSITQQFVEAFYRNGFNNLAGLPPLGKVKTLGTTAGYYVQEFPDSAATAGVRYALASASAAATGGVAGGASNYVVQIYGSEYAYYLTVGASTAGYPLSDTLTCPNFDPANSCTFQFFDKGYALFAYANALVSGLTTFTVRQGFYTEWTALGGVSGIGRPVSAETAVTATKIAPATAGSTATAQTFSGGVIYSITTGAGRGQVHGVTEPFYDLYVNAGGPTGSLGLPLSEVVVNTVTGVRTQTFEGGVLQSNASGGGILYPVTAVNLTGATLGTTVTLSLGQSLTVTATPVDALGDQLTNLPVSWTTTNGQVIAVAPQPNSQSAVLTAVGGGAASVTAASGGKTSGSISLVVIAACCQVGDGAPQAVQSAFQTALARNKITAQIPVSAPATRAGSGYVQMVQQAGATTASYLLAESDQSGSAYVVSGTLLAQYQTLGGPAGSLGYPLSDGSAGGTQLFQNGALAGTPVQIVAGGILAKWKLLGYETGAAGAPSAAQASFSTFGANGGVWQSFAGGAIYAAASGPRAGNSYFVSGVVLAAYNAASGPGGNLGMPLSDEFATAAGRQQNFEGGSIGYAAGATAAQVQFAPRVPAVIVAPSAISAGASALLALSGFANGASVTVSVTGQPDFVVTTANGAYSWSLFIPFRAASGMLNIRGVDAKNSVSAGGTLTIKGFDSNRVQLTQVRGNNQTGAPGALLPVPLQIALFDASGAPIVGAPVLFQASAGVQLSVTATVTDAGGQAATFARLPSAAGVAGITATSSIAQQATVSFYEVAAATSISNFPSVQQSGSGALGNGTATIGQKGALLASVAAILRYQQNRNAVGSPNGLADAPTLNQYLTAYCGVDGAGNKVCDGFLSNPSSGEQIVNLWRAAEFTGGLDATVVNPSLSGVADLVSQGEPVLLSLGLSLNRAPAGGHFVVATGIAADGSIIIQDPSPVFARGSLGDYLNGFSAAGGTWTASLLGAVRFAVRNPSVTRFMLGALSQPTALIGSLAFDVSSPAGTCGLPIQMMDTVDASGNAPAAGPLLTKLQVCDGSLATYQVSVGAAQPYEAFVTDLASGGATFNLSGGAPGTYQATRPLLNLVLARQLANFTAAAVVNAATFTAGIAPGGIVSIFGSGLAGSAGATAVDVDGEPLAVLSASSFQINAVLPQNVAPGPHIVRVTSPYGTAQQPVTVSAVAPAIFLVGNPPVGAVENQDGSLNGPFNPALRSQALVVFATGLGTATRKGQLLWADTPVTATLNGVEVPVSFAGQAPGFPGLSQINIMIPSAMPPGSVTFLTLKQGEMFSNTVSVAIQ